MTYDEYITLRHNRPELQLPLLSPECGSALALAKVTEESFVSLRVHQLLTDWGDFDTDTMAIPLALQSWFLEHPEYEAAKTKA